MRILLATDGSDDAKAATAWLSHLPLPEEREVLVLTAVDQGPRAGIPEVIGDFHRALIADARRLADNTAAELLSVGRRTIGRVVDGDPRDEIVEAATTWGADLVVVGARGLGAISAFLLGSVSLGVARHAPCPVLVCKGTPRDVRRVTVALDGSDHARHALTWLAALPLRDGTQVRLLAVAEPQHYPATAPGIVRDAVRAAVAEITAEREAVLEGECTTASATLRGRAVAVESRVRTGKPSEEIVRDAEAHDTDLIVLGARGLGAFKRLVLGSVSESVLRHAGSPVLIVRPRA